MTKLTLIEDDGSNFSLPGIGGILLNRILSQIAIEDIKKDPYVIMDVDGISFQRADKVAKLLKISDNDPRRIKALLKNLFSINGSFGHVYLPETQLRREAAKQKIPLPPLIDNQFVIDGLPITDIVHENGCYYLKHFLRAEEFVAKDLIDRLNNYQTPPLFTGVKNRKLDFYQNQFISHLTTSPSSILILTGGPGTGKTYITNTIVELCEENNKRFELLAPTGKAANRLSELTNHPASTIHRAFNAPFWNFLSTDIAIIDEASMIDLFLASRIMACLPKTAKLIFIGDVDQLAPVGPGNFFKDIIKSKLFPTTRLLTNHRQGSGSSIADNAIRINIGAMQLSFDEDFSFVECQNPVEVREKILEISKTLKEEIGDFQILTPQKKTIIGVESLNEILRTIFNPGAKFPFDVGDKVMQTANDYQRDIFNGYIGTIVERVKTRSRSSDTVRVNFGNDHIVETTTANLIHAWASTIHKFQGSEFPVGIIVISSAHTFMLTRNLFYTGITRAKNKCFVLGDRLALKKAITNTREQLRYTKLLERLKK